MNGWGEGLEKNSTKNLTMALRLFKVRPQWGAPFGMLASAFLLRASAPKQSAALSRNRVAQQQRQLLGRWRSSVVVTNPPERVPRGSASLTHSLREG